jgi:RecB family exonuclease
MERIVDGCGELVCSYAQMSDDALQRPSALVSDFTPAEIASEAHSSLAIPLETVGDDHWIPFTHTAVVPGGHMPLKRQADCPFQAFIFHRLHARELAIAGRGLSPGDRGTLVHKIVEGIWSKDLGGYTHLTSQADLHRATSAGTLRPLVAEHAAAAIRSIGAENTERWQRAYLKAEEERAIDLVMDWLAVECARQPFEVLTVEEKATIQVGDLALNVRADRIDRIPGGKLLVDYKTGEVSTASWEGARPEQPQLPLYAAFGDAKGLIGAVFAQVRWPKPQFKGRVSNARANLSDVLDAKDPLVAAPYTEDVVEEWRGTLLNLAESFVRGEARVDPHVYPKSCQYCPLAGVCRVAECRGTPVRGDSVEEEEAE